MYTYILVCTCTNLDVQTINGMYWYILVCTDHVTGFRGKHRDAAMLEEPGPSVESENGHEDGDPSPCPEDEEFFLRPDAGAMDEAIGKFLDGLDGQERSGFQELHRFLETLPVPATKETSSMTHAEAIVGRFLPDMDDEQRKRFTPTEIIMYKHALEYRYIPVYTSTYLYVS